jgi:type VI secretion system secreted protein Hcp
MSIQGIFRRSLLAAVGIGVFTCAAYGAAQAAAGSMSCASATGGAGAGKIQISSFQWGSSRGVTSPTGGSADRQSSAPSISEITITKTQDASSPNLFKALLGKPQGLGTCTLTFVKGNQPKEAPYLTITLTNTMISGYSLSSGGDRPTESITLNFTKIVFTDKVAGPGETTDTLLKTNLAPSPSPKPKT